MPKLYLGTREITPAFGESAAVINSLSITPTTSSQTITASGGVDGYSPISVSAVDSSIDANITAGNIKSGVSILGVSGTVTELKGETRSVSITSTSGNTFTPTSGKNGITSITVTPTNQAKTITPTTSSQSISVPSGYSGFGTLTVNAVTSSIDNNITAGNIKSGVSILGVSGSLTPLNGTTLSVTPSTSAQSLSPSSPYNGYTSVSVSAVTSSIDSNISSGNIKKDVTILGVTGTLESGTTINNQDKTITSNGTYTADEGYTGLGTVTVNVSGSNKRKFGISIDDLIGDLSNGQYQVRTTADVDVSFDGLTSFQKLNGSSSNGTWVMSYIFTNSQCIRSVTFPSITSIASYPYNSLEYFCYGSRSIETVSFPALTSVLSNYTFSHAFDDCRKLSTVSFPVLETVGGTGTFQYAFNRTVMLKTISFPSLVNASGFINAFTSSAIETVQFPLLSSIGSTMVFYQTFISCRKLTNIYFNGLTTTSFGSYTDQFKNIFDTITGADSGAFTMHFPSNLETTIQGLTGYPNFGATAGRLTLAFDLTATS